MGQREWQIRFDLAHVRAVNVRLAAKFARASGTNLDAAPRIR
jgi:hypothetical protein